MGAIKRMSSFKTQRQWEEWRKHHVESKLGGGYEDSWATDKKWLKSWDGIYSCRWCGQPMSAAMYVPGDGLYMTCHTSLCPGNINEDTYKNGNFANWDIREMTNQYLFNSLLKF